MDRFNYQEYNEDDQFELLSAYLDGEVTATERQRIEQWLATDESSKRLYMRLLKLRHGVRTMPVPSCYASSPDLFSLVWKRIIFRRRINWMWGSAAIAACVIGSISGILPANTSRLQLAQQKIDSGDIQTQAPISPLMVALNNPIVEIPKTAVVQPPAAEELEYIREEMEFDINNQ
ncbi:anti-sigma factor family protein [Cylindrospermopsis curvispora]|uniref:Zf-HC2 domain-containing protein n=1 Tax=Cylindrospermopsis curvispora GIHE-G1 TaxID=2666332 RepID=A0A7H0F387_9CYAN|nr:zf-HC2 domain-containing protein [Cylindrospermopsis curvispora]QNP30503.1 zf-HC2 domain-containing protein [Cylindrospermopsis curvispora GIHE-G1]